MEREKEEFRVEMDSCLEQLSQYEQNIDQAHKGRQWRGDSHLVVVNVE